MKAERTQAMHAFVIHRGRKSLALQFSQDLSDILC